MANRGWMGALVLLLGASVALPQEKRIGDLETTVRKLEKDIAAVRGLAFKKPVTARIIARAKDAPKGIQGYYSLKEKALFVYDDVTGVYERGVLIHEMVHALQDQHFGLAKLHESSFGSDAELALAALIEGDATCTMIEVLQKEQPRVSMMLESPLEKSRNLRNAFLYAQGTRYVKALKERGGWAAVNSAYKTPPRSTAAVLFPEMSRSTVTLGPGVSRGALGIVETLAANQATAPLALAAAKGWRGDRTIQDGEAQAWAVAFGTAEEARRFHEAMVKLRKAQQPDLKDVLNGAQGNIWRDARGGTRAVLVRGERVWVLDAPDEARFRSLHSRLESPLLSVWSAKDRRLITFGQLTDRLLESDIICVGEAHDSDPHHHVQLRIIKGLFAQDERLGVGLEMFQRPVQPVLDRFGRGEIGEEAMLQSSEYHKRWGFDWSLYRPIAEFSRKNGIPLAALNVPRELTQRLSRVGHSGLSGDEKTQLGEIDFQVKDHRGHWFDRLAQMHGQANAPAEQKERSYQVMAAWDGYMAASAARFQQERQLRRLVILAGRGHIDRGFGIPARAAKLTGGKIVTVGIEIGKDPAVASAEAVTDFIVFVEPLPHKGPEKK